MTRDEVKKYDGKNGNPAYIVYKNKIYDVTVSKLWQDGTHMIKHKAGDDLTEFINKAPHGEEVLFTFPCLGTFEGGTAMISPRKECLMKWYQKYHPHPMLIHFPMGLFCFSSLMLFLHLVYGNASFELSAYYALIVAVISVYPTVVAGLFSWFVNYNLKLNRIFLNKIIFSVLLMVVSTITVVIRIFYSEIMNYLSTFRLLYVVMFFINIPLLTVVGYNGGKITWS